MRQDLLLDGPRGRELLSAESGRQLDRPQHRHPLRHRAHPRQEQLSRPLAKQGDQPVRLPQAPGSQLQLHKRGHY